MCNIVDLASKMTESGVSRLLNRMPASAIGDLSDILQALAESCPMKVHFQTTECSSKETWRFLHTA